MKTTKNTDENGNIISFEVPVDKVGGQRGFTKFLSRLEEIKVTHKPMPILSSIFGEEEFCKFIYKDLEFVAADMFSSSDNFIVVPQDRKSHKEIELLAGVFSNEGHKKPSSG